MTTPLLLGLSLPDLAWALALVLVPLSVVLIDTVGALRSRETGRQAPVEAVEDFEVVVPIWGSVRYLTNVDYLADYGDRVVLCTTTAESAEFDAELDRIAAENGFRVFRGDPGEGYGAADGARQTSGVVRDRLVRDIHAVLGATYVVCIDADTRTVEPLGVLVARIAEAGYDLASVRVVPANTTSWLGRLQAHEYRAAMRLRLLAPWLVSGACHAGRRTAHREVMRRHSLFFQGNDVEVGWLGQALGFKVGHVVFDVPTDVPDTVRAWWRQRYAWAGGEVRLFLLNPQLVLRHPMMWLYGAVITIAGAPMRWLGALEPSTTLIATAGGYLAVLALVHHGHWDRYLPLVPLYSLVSSLVLVPLGLVSYVRMAVQHRNAGLIRAGRTGGGGMRPLVAATD